MPTSPRKNTLNVLLIEDSASDAALLSSYMEDTASESFAIIQATTIADALPLLVEKQVDAVMLDLFLPDTIDLNGLYSIQAIVPNVPVIILTGRDDDKLANKAVAHGAQDYLVKDIVDARALYRSLHYAIQRKRHEKGLLHQAYYDNLTGLANRHLFNERFDIALARQERSRRALAVMMIDLNGFKKINDEYGHAAGDAVLKEIGRRIPQCLRSYDLISRFGGDEFVVLIEDATDHRDYATIANKVIEIIDRPMIIQSRQLSVGASIGIAVGANDGTPIKGKALLEKADEAMYKAKKRGCNAFELMQLPSLPNSSASIKIVAA
jgi:diguanylate cyclase (GGDEF)-like protein